MEDVGGLEKPQLPAMQLDGIGDRQNPLKITARPFIRNVRGQGL